MSVDTANQTEIGSDVLVSIVMVTFNAEAVVERTLRSVMAQSQTGLELLCIDGVSRDRTLEIVERYRAEIPKLRVVSEPDDSLYDAMNKGILQARGDYVLFLNAGDFFADDRVLTDLATHLEQSTGPRPTLIYGHTVLEYQNEVRQIRRVRDLSYIAHGQPTIHQSVFFRTEEHARVPYRYKEFPISADYQAMAEMQMLPYGHVMVWDRMVSVFSVDPRSISSRNLRQRLVDAWRVQQRIVRTSLGKRLMSAARRVAAHVYYSLRGLGAGSAKPFIKPK